MAVTVKQIKKGKVKTFRLDRQQFIDYILNLKQISEARKIARQDMKRKRTRINSPFFTF